MATKLTVFGQDEPKKELKKIEFVKCLATSGVLVDTTFTPNCYDNVDCIVKGLGTYDIFNAWNDEANCKSTFLGYFNDGVV